MYKRGAGEEAMAVMNGFTESIRESNSTGKNNKETNLWPPIQTESLDLSQLIVHMLFVLVHLLPSSNISITM
ncbi:Anaphase-promoting complex subunit [Trichinella pseudospiralis]